MKLHLWTARILEVMKAVINHPTRRNWGREGSITGGERTDHKQTSEMANVGIKPGSGKSKREDTD